MGRPKNIQINNLAELAEQELKKIEEAGLCIRLFAIIQASKRSVDEVAEEFAVSPRTVFRWLSNFNENGLEGLRGDVKGHRQSKFSPFQRKLIATWVENGVNSRGRREDWTLEKLKQSVFEEFGVEISIMPLWLHLQKMGIRLRRGTSTVREACAANGD